MRYRIFFLLLIIFFLFYLYLSYLNPEKVKFYLGGGRVFEATLATHVMVGFLIGLLLSTVTGFIFDAKRLLQKWKVHRENKIRQEVSSLLEKAKHHDSKGERDKAIEIVNRAIRKVPTFEEPYILLANIHASSKNFEQAIEALNLAEMNVGKKEGILEERAALNIKKKDYERAERDLKEILRINELNFNALLMLRKIYVLEGRWEDALSLQKKIIKHIKTEEEEINLLGIKFEKIRSLLEKEGSQVQEKVVKELKEILSENKRFVPAYILLASIYEKMGKLNEAGRVYGRGYSKTGHVIFLKKMEDLYIGRGEPGVILKIYRRILEVSPKDKLISFLYALLCLRLEMIGEAMDTLNQLQYEGLNIPGLYRAMAEAYIHRGELKKAVENFLKACPSSELLIPFICTNCQQPKKDWVPFCDSCYSWNTVNVKKEEFTFEESEEFKKLYEEEGGENI
jgi:tetratricopeptide (TPR) repeat protein